MNLRSGLGRATRTPRQVSRGPKPQKPYNGKGSGAHKGHTIGAVRKPPRRRGPGYMNG